MTTQFSLIKFMNGEQIEVNTDTMPDLEGKRRTTH